MFKSCIAIALGLILALGSSSYARADELTPSAWCIEYLLASWTPGTPLQPVLDGISADPATRNAANLDKVAEFLVRGLAGAQLSKDEAKPVLELLTRTKSGRYRLTMASVRATAKPAVLKEMAQEYELEHKRKTVDQYVPGTIDFTSLRTRYFDAALAVKPTQARAEALASMQEGDSMEKLFSLVGPPQHVDTGYYRASETLNFRRLLLYYRGAGRAVFGLTNGGWAFQATIVDPLAFEALMPYRARAAEFSLPDDAALRMAQITSGSLVAMKIAVENAYEVGQPSHEFLDTAAEILAQSWRTVEEEVAEDVDAWIIRLLTKRGGPRYSGLLDQIVHGKHSLKLMKWAGLPIQRAAGMPAGKFVAGSVSLAEKAQKYPSLYPEVVLRSGRL